MKVNHHSGVKRLMAKYDNSPKPSADEKVVAQIEDVLRRLAIDGELDLPVSDEILMRYGKEMSPEAGERMWARIQKRVAVADRFRLCPDRPEAEKLPFPDLIRTLRTNAGVSVDEAAKAVRLKFGDMSALEEGRKDPLKIPADVLANVMEVYWLPVALFVQSLKRLVADRAVRRELSGVSARSTKGIADEDYERAFQDIASHIASERKADTRIELPADFLEALRSTLRQRGRTDLL